MILKNKPEAKSSLDTIVYGGIAYAAVEIVDVLSILGINVDADVIQTAAFAGLAWLLNYLGRKTGTKVASKSEIATELEIGFENTVNKGG